MFRLISGRNLLVLGLDGLCGLPVRVPRPGPDRWSRARSSTPPASRSRRPWSPSSSPTASTASTRSRPTRRASSSRLASRPAATRSRPLREPGRQSFTSASASATRRRSNFILGAARGGAATKEDAAKAAALKAVFDEGVAPARPATTTRPSRSSPRRRAWSRGCFDCYYNIGYNYSQKKDYDKAEAAFLKAIEMKAELRRGLQRAGDGLQRAEEVRQGAGGQPEGRRARRRGRAGRRRRRRRGRRVQPGRHRLERRQDPRGGRALREGDLHEAGPRRRALPARAWRFVNQGKLAEAVPMFEKYLELAPDGPVRGHGEGHPVEHQEVGAGMEVPSRRDDDRGKSCSGPTTAGPRARAGRPVAFLRPPGRHLEDPPGRGRAGGLRRRARLEFGENRVQEALQKIGATSDIPIEWHLVGHLQSNKARKAAASFACIHSIDSADLLAGWTRRRRRRGRRPGAARPGGPGRRADQARRPADAWLSVFEAAAGMPGGAGDRAHAAAAVHAGSRGRQAVFPAAAGRCATSWPSRGVPPAMLRELSMGMSHDFEVAVEEGATIVRVGTAIFGER